MKTKATKTQRVYAFLTKGNTLTANYGRNKMNIDHVGRQVYILRKAGYNIVSKAIPSRKLGGSRVKYSLVA